MAAAERTLMLLRAFPGYDLRTLDRDYCKLLKLLEIERLGSRRAVAGGEPWQSSTS